MIKAICLPLCVAAALSASPAPAAGPAPARFNAIIVDTSPMAARGVSRLAERVRAALTPALAEAFAGRVGDRSAPDLVVRIDSFDFATTGLSGRDPPESDTLDGSVSVVAGRNVLSSYPLLTRQNARTVGGWYLPDNEQRRLVRLSASFAQWARQMTGG